MPAPPIMYSGILTCICIIMKQTLSNTNIPPVFDAMPSTCQSDNWGMPYQKSPRPFNPNFETEIRLPCMEQWKRNEKPMSKLLDAATILWYKNNQDYDNLKAQDWVPENRHLYHMGASWGQSKLTDFSSYPPNTFMASTCTNNLIDGLGQWEVTRIGPIRTTGGYDWLQVGWENIWDFKSKLEKYPDGIYVLEQYMSPVWENGTMIQHPPIHIHHMHIGPSPYVRYRTDNLGCIIFGKGCFNPSRAMEIHGDYNCLDTDGGMNCRIETVPAGFGKLVRTQALKLALLYFTML